MSARIRTLISLLLLGVLLGCAPDGGDGDGDAARDGERARPATSAKTPFWVDPGSPAARQVQAYKQQGRAEDAALLERPRQHLVQRRSARGDEDFEGQSVDVGDRRIVRVRRSG
jgi:hypothetical protein